MLIYPDINPVALQLGPFKVHWYGVMYLIGFLGAWGLARLQAKRLYPDWRREQIADMIFFSAIGVILGGRMGYVLFYDLTHFLQNPWSLFFVWQGGMSFHGGLLGVILALWLFSRKTKKPFLQVCDFVAPLVPIGLAAGRIGNFINGELWGRVTSVPWAMVFPQVDQHPRHPSMLYEFFLEGILLFLIVGSYALRRRSPGSVAGLFLLAYGALRFAVEWVREPDIQMGFIAFDWMTMGQLLSIPMMIAGSWLLYKARNKMA